MENKFSLQTNSLNYRNTEKSEAASKPEPNALVSHLKVDSHRFSFCPTDNILIQNQNLLKTKISSDSIKADETSDNTKFISDMLRNGNKFIIYIISDKNAFNLSRFILI